MGLTEADVERVHHRIGPLDEVVEQRRLLYRTVIELLGGADVAALATDDVLDNPAVRGHLGAVLSGSAVLLPDHLLSTNVLVADGYVIDINGIPLRVATSCRAQSDLLGAVQRIEDELGRHGEKCSPLQMLGPEDDRFSEAFRLVADGARMAVQLVPRLALDLLAHVAVVVLLGSTEAGRLGSASAREFPGVVLIPEPGTPLEVAEALIHEGAHQKFFDLAMTHEMLVAEAQHAPRYIPTWSKSDASGWPLEQALAAFHAYCCIDVMARSIDDRADLVLHPHSLLPYAHARFTEIGNWLRRQGGYLGEDAHTLIAELSGQAPDDLRISERVDATVLLADRPYLVRTMGSRTLVAVHAEPPELLWVLAEVP
jgi:hypothetical protein